MKNDGRSERALCARDRRNHSNKRLLAIRNIGRIKDGGASQPPVHPTTSCSNTLSRFGLEQRLRTSLTHTLRATLCVLFGLFKLLFGAVLNRSVIEPRMCPGRPWMYLYVYSFAKSVTKKVGMYYSAGDRADNNVVKSSSSRGCASLYSTPSSTVPGLGFESGRGGLYTNVQLMGGDCWMDRSESE